MNVVNRIIKILASISVVVSFLLCTCDPMDSAQIAAPLECTVVMWSSSRRAKLCCHWTNELFSMWLGVEFRAFTYCTTMFFLPYRFFPW